jgi:chemotaxis-related protein WspD
MTALPILDNCWDRIGIGGDRSCPELPRHAHCRNCPVFAAAAQTFFDRPPPDDYLIEWTEILATAEPETVGDLLSVVIFRLHDEWLALPTVCLVEVTLPRPAHRVPHRSNAVFVGLVNIRGQLHPCVSLHGVLGIEAGDAVAGSDDPSMGGRRRLLVMEHQGERWVFAADEVEGVEQVARDQLRKVPGTLANPAHHFSQAVFHWRERHIGLLDEDRVLQAFRGLGV